MAKDTTRKLFDPEITPANMAGKSKDLDKKAEDKVLAVLKFYDGMRTFIQGGIQVRLKDRWDEMYRLYMAIRCADDHNYDGEAQVFLPVARRAVNVIESEASNALFSRDDYFSFDAIGDSTANKDMSRRGFGILKFYSDQENYVSEFELTLKQELIYGITACEITFSEDLFINLERKIDEEPEVDDITGENMVDAKTGAPATKKVANVYQVTTRIQHPRVEVRDIYRMYVNLLSNDPEKEDIIYRDAMSAQRLLIMAEDGQYNKKAVMEMLKKDPTSNFGELENSTDNGDGKTFVNDLLTQDKLLSKYEILRFQGWFNVEDEKTGIKKQKQYWIDLGERKHVLRIQENPLLGQDKTFCLVNYDTMINEFATSGIIDAIKSLQYEINDKENQSLDALTHDLNAPYEVLKNSGLDDSDIDDIYNTPHKTLFVRERNSVQKLTSNINTGHLVTELNRLDLYVDKVTGSTNLASGSPTGTQADRSGKALGLLQNQTRSQFSKTVRKFERKIIQNSLNKLWKLIVQFGDDEIEIELLKDEEQADGTIKQVSVLESQHVSEVTGQYNIKVSGGSQYLKEREYRDAIMEFITVLGMNDVFFKMADHPGILEVLAKSSSHDMSKFIKPDNLYKQMSDQIAQLQQMIEMAQQQIKMYGGEVMRLGNELKQTPRSNMVNPPASQQIQEATTPQGENTNG